MNYYNDNDKKVCAWLMELIKAGLIPEGDVDDRSIADIRPDELDGYTQCHFFAGIGGWAYALRLAGWPDDRPVWTGSCPCQPFSVAGKRKGEKDERHLWPAFRWLIQECQPSVVFGEQVASKDGRFWLSGVRSDLETLGYEVGAADLCAAGVGAPHIRQRLFWVGNSVSDAERGAHRGTCGIVGNGMPDQREGRQIRDDAGHDGDDGGVADGIKPGLEGQSGHGDRRDESGRNQKKEAGSASESGSTVWDQSIWWPCRDGKYRRIPANSDGQFEPEIFPLSYGVSGRVGLLRGAGNAIVPQVAAKFIESFVEVVETLKSELQAKRR